MRYRPEHKAEVHHKIVKDASRRVRSEGLNGAAVAAVMRDNGLTHGGFYKHFENKDELLMESVHEAFREIADRLTQVGAESPPETAWKEIVKAYLDPKSSEHVERGCPLPVLAPELARLEKKKKDRVVAELVNYRDRMLPFMPGRRRRDRERAFFAIFSTLIGAVALARLLPEPVQEMVLGSAREFLLRSYFPE